jgi:ABC-type multidrug transport system fused ATPase/permease subunit
MKILFIGAILVSMSLPVSCAVMGLVAFFYFFTRLVTKRMSYSIGRGRIEAGEEQNILINEMINGIKQIKVFLAEERWRSRFYKATDSFFKLAKKDNMLVNAPFSALEVFALVSLSVFLILIKKISPASLASNLPLLGVFAYAFQRIMPSISLMTSMRMQILGQIAAFEVLHSVITGESASVKDGEKTVDSFSQRIEFRHVSFAYPGKKPVLKNITFSFEKNECTAIVGPSGSGKTTMVNLIIRLFDPTEGAVLVDGADLRDYKRGSWLSRIGFVSQDTFIFHASVQDNIAFGLEMAGMDEIREAAVMANAHDFIIKLPNGYDTIVGERGMKLSGGEQQRIAIARAILRKPQILIFDEATSALDNVSQALIQESINKIIKKHTVILIAHRLSTIGNANKIVVLDAGQVREMGTHQTLIRNKGVYWQLYNRDGELATAV